MFSLFFSLVSIILLRVFMQSKYYAIIGSKSKRCYIRKKKKVWWWEGGGGGVMILREIVKN